MNGLQHKNIKTSCDRRATSELGPNLSPQLGHYYQTFSHLPLLFAAEVILSNWEVLLTLKESSHG